MKIKELCRYGLPAFIFLVLTAPGIWSDEIQSSIQLLSELDPGVYSVLSENDMVFRYDDEFTGPSYLPDVPSRTEIMVLHRSLKPEVMVEALYRIPYPEGQGPESGKFLELIYDLSHKVSSISGAKYFSVRSQDYSVLFTDVYAVEDLKKKKKISDPQPAGYRDESAFIHMKENALGRGYYRMDYMPSDDLLTVSLTNESSLGFIITAVEPKNMVIYLQIIPCSDTVLIYGYCGVVLENDGLVNLMLDPYYAFYRRMTAMETWLYNSLHGTDMLPPLMEPLP